MEGLVLNMPDHATWIEGTDQFCYRRSMKDGHEFVLVDAATLARKPAFDHERLAAALSKATGQSYTAHKLPFAMVEFRDKGQAIEVPAADFFWKCSLGDYACQKTGPAPWQFQRHTKAQPDTPEPKPEPAVSPDGKWEAIILNFNVYVRPKGNARRRSSELRRIGKQLLRPRNHRVVAGFEEAGSVPHSPGYRRRIQYIESSPEDQLQPKTFSVEYPKPGDTLDLPQPALFDLAARSEINLNNTLYPNPYEMSLPVWRKDSHAFTFEYNQRGHQAYRVLEADASSGQVRALDRRREQDVLLLLRQDVPS